MAERLPGSRAPPPGQSGYCSLLMRFHAPVRHNDFREMLHAALTQLDGPIPKSWGLFTARRRHTEGKAFTSNADASLVPLLIIMLKENA